MNKTKTEVKEDKILKEANKIKEAKENLKVQYKDYLDKADYYKTMATKAQGAIEVLMQLHPEEENK